MKSTVFTGFTCLLISMLLASCSSQQVRSRSSVVDYLYPNTSEIVTPTIPRLALPLKVGIAFVPEQRPEHKGMNFWSYMHHADSLTESGKMDLLEKVANHFKSQDFIEDIELIPSSYLTPKGSFANLEQIKTMYGIDVIALVSYDQVQFTDEGALSFTYWTLIGAYIIKGERNDTQTMLDTAVYDINSRKMLFRAPGTSHVSGSATLVNLNEQLRTDSKKGFDAAASEMVNNLDIQLERFKVKVKESPKQAEITYKPSFSGGGGGTLDFLLFPLLLALIMMSHRRG